MNLPLNELIGYIIIGFGFLLIFIGIAGFFRYTDFYARIGIVSVIDTAGFILCVLGMMIYRGLSLFSLKLGIILLFTVLLNPIANHIIIRGAFTSGYSHRKE